MQHALLGVAAIDLRRTSEGRARGADVGVDDARRDAPRTMWMRLCSASSPGRRLHLVRCDMYEVAHTQVRAGQQAQSRHDLDGWLCGAPTREQGSFLA